MKIWHKILVAPAVAVFVLAVFGVFAYSVIAMQRAAIRDLADSSLAEVIMATEASREIGEVHSSVYRLFTSIATLSEEKVKQAVQQQRIRVEVVTGTLRNRAEQENISETEKELIAEAIPNLDKYRNLAEQAIDSARGDLASNATVMQAADQQHQLLQKNLIALVEYEQSTAQKVSEQAATSSTTALAVLGVLGTVGVITAFLLAIFMSRRIVAPLDRAIAAAGRIAAGDMSTHIEVKGSDETASLLRALSTMSSNLQTLVAEVAAGAHSVADTSEQIAHGNLDLSQRTEEQASTLEETASSMEQLTATVQHNAEHARTASDLAEGAARVAQKGGEVVQRVVTTMSEISTSSARIAEIIGVIDGIAFQTNILALNAAVEAARAGEQGRGFAVVASEVRSLAHRTAEAAKEIKKLIAESAKTVTSGADQVERAGQTMAEVVASVQHVSQLIREIAEASNEQSAGIRQVNSAITRMDHVVQQNASLVEEATAATELMKAEAGVLLQAVSKFTLRQQDQPAEASRALVEQPSPQQLQFEPYQRAALHIG